MLPGTEIGAALGALEAMDVDLIGLNCATGPAEMCEPLRHLPASHHPIVLPAQRGTPVGGGRQMHYDLTPEQLAEYHRRSSPSSASRSSVGAAARRPAHLAAVVAACADPRRLSASR